MMKSEKMEEIKYGGPVVLPPWETPLGEGGGGVEWVNDWESILKKFDVN